MIHRIFPIASWALVASFLTACGSDSGGTEGAAAAAGDGPVMGGSANGGSVGGASGSGGDVMNGGAAGLTGGSAGVTTGGTSTGGIAASGGALIGGNAGSGGDVSGGSAGTGGALTGGNAGSGGDVSGGSAGTGGALTGGNAGSGGDVSGGSAGTGGTEPVCVNGWAPAKGTGNPGPSFSGTDDEHILQMALRFYGAQRSGTLKNPLTSGPSFPGDSVTLDGTRYDLSGGWHDAGDHVKVTLTIAYAAYVMLKAYDAFPAGFADRDSPDYTGSPNGIPDVLDEARVGLDWLVKAHPRASTVVAMVADADLDHLHFYTSPYQSTLPTAEGGEPRPVQLGAGADFAGLLSAALALGARMYASYDASLAATYRAKAESAYTYAKAHPQLSDSQLYAWVGSSWRDDLLAAAAELYVGATNATARQTYLNDALSQNTRIARTYWVANSTQVADFARHTLHAAGQTAALTNWRAEVEEYMVNVTSDPYLAGLTYYDEWGTLRYALGAAFSAALLYEATGDATYRDFALSQYDFVKGNNPYDRSFIIGWGVNPPQRPHHRNAFGHNDTTGFENPAAPGMDNCIPFEHLLTGALVGGPTSVATGPSQAGYADDFNDYLGNEVALDYNAGLIGMAAFGASGR